MEQARLLLAIVLSFLVFFIWSVFFTEKPNPVENEAVKTSAQENIQDSHQEKIVKTDLSEIQQRDDASIINNKNFRTITVKNNLYVASISEKGAVFTSLLLKNYREEVEKNSKLKQLIFGKADRTLDLSFERKSFKNLETAYFQSDLTYDEVKVFDEKHVISFRWTSPSGLIIEKRYSFYPDSYLIDLDIIVKNGTDRSFSDSLVLSLNKDSPHNKNAYGFEGPSGLINNKLEQIKIKKIEDKNSFSGKIEWIALEGRYFISTIIPISEENSRMKLSLLNNEIVKSSLISEPDVIESGNQKTFQYKLFFGPKSLEIMGKAGYKLKKAINFGMFDIIAKPCLLAMNYLYKFIPNYGLSIILITILIKIILWPLGSKSYKSMSEMKKLQPLMAELREKHKGDKTTMNKELMGLYKTYKINPLGGCLPMVLQIPVFFALYRMLYQAIELRHAPFIFWINDLSAPDRLFNFGFSIPFMEPPIGIPVLTIIMGGTMFLQQKMSPPPGDPAQAKMMMFMPIIFTFIFINFSSGLVLYWLINNILSISQQYYIQQKNA